ncbi:galactokinase [Ruthenibacterium lactatiformans]|uniref:galactokinase n=1 Tax=Ruthenibacterium lactatiformans TaxID=1550024 RepID=UPI000B0298A5
MSTAKELKKEIERGVWDASLGKLYGRRAGVLERQRARYADALDCFAALYGGEREAAIYSAPGRTEIGGNHTDHNHGVVMAGAVDLDVIAVVSKNTDDVVRVKSKGFDGRDEVKLEQLSPVPAEQGRSAALIRGVAAGIAKQGGVLGGFDAYTTSDVLRGSGLSSSAAFEVVIGTVFNGEYNQGRFSAVDIAKISQYAENEYFGKPSGLMDQTACSVGSVITIDFRDPASPVVEKVDFDLAKHDYCLCITDTKGSHASLTDEYAAVRQEMEAVAAYFDKPVLREVDESAFYADIAGVREKLGDRAVLRAIHVFCGQSACRCVMQCHP